MSLTYRDIISVLTLEGIEQYIPDGTAHSYPVMSMENGYIVDCFFLYEYSPNKATFSYPTGRLALEPSSGKLLYYYSSDDKPFKKDYSDHVYPIIFKYSKDERWDANKKYQEYYMKVREFAFQNSLTPEQNDILLEYLRVFKILVPQRQTVFYEAISPLFFEWTTTTTNDYP